MKKKLRRYFISGLIVFLPLALTVNLLILTFNFADSLLGKYLKPIFLDGFGFYPPGVGILVCILLILSIGLFVTNFLGRNLFPFIENLILKLPFFKQVYPAIKEISVFFFSRDKISFQQVVLIEYPRKGLYSIGFLTQPAHRKLSENTGKELFYVFVPHTPSPLTGFLTIVAKEELIFPDITVEEAIKIVVSAGVVNFDKTENIIKRG